MKVTLHFGDVEYPIRVESGLPHAFVDVACPHCAAKAPTKIADARTLCCNNAMGTIRAVVQTLFGLEEDEAVLAHGRARVYTGAT